MDKAKIAKLPSGIGVWKTVNGRGEVFWLVRMGKRYTGGPVVKKHFKTLADAKEWLFGEEGKNRKVPSVSMIDLKKDAGAGAFQLTASQISEAAAAIKSLGDTATLTEAVKYFLKHARPVGGVFSLQEAIDALIKDKKAAGKGDRHLNGLRWNLERFAGDFTKLKIHEITRQHIEEWLEEEEDFSTTTRRNYFRDLSILFNFALKREWVASVPLVGITKPTPGPGEIRILSPEDTREFLDAAGKVFPPIVAPLAIKFFAGLRTSELFKLEWSKVNSDQILIEANHAKTRKRRGVSISPNLKVWLQGLLKDKGPVTDVKHNAWHRRIQAIVEHVNLERKKAHGKKAVEFRLPSNFARHSFCSYHYAYHRNENLTAAEAGNSPGVIFSNYREMVTPEKATSYWSILPENPTTAGPATPQT